ncbi:20764_t:CDS:1, partial [Rhizophagus irregularis]
YENKGNTIVDDMVVEKLWFGLNYYVQIRICSISWENLINFRENFNVQILEL